MSRMSELHADLTEMIQRGYRVETIVEAMVAEGLPREACLPMIDALTDQISEDDGQPDEAQEWADFDPEC